MDTPEKNKTKTVKAVAVTGSNITPVGKDFIAKVAMISLEELQGMTPEQLIQHIVDITNVDSLLRINNEALEKENTSLNATIVVLTNEKNTLEEQLKKLSEEMAVEVGRLSKELAQAKKEAGKSTLSIEIDGVRYTTPANRKYNVEGKETPIEDILQNEKLCELLIERRSKIFTKTEAE